MEAVKSYRIPVEPPRDLVGSYFEVKGRVLEAVLSKVRFSEEAHLELKNGDRRKLREVFKALG